MVEIVPAVLASTPAEYDRDLERATALSRRIQVDLSDGRFAQNRTVNLAQVHWPSDIQADLHLMYHNPAEHTHTIIALRPHLVIVHAEAEQTGVHRTLDLLSELHNLGVKTGLALLGPTSVDAVAEYLPLLDHVLVFTGELGHYGGQLDHGSLNKIAEVKALKPGLEVGVDGGINDETAAIVVSAGADVLNVGGYLQKAKNPVEAYAKLQAAIGVS